MLCKSRYTVTAAAPDGRTLLYNTANGAFACASAEAMECYESCDGPLASQFADAGFLTSAAPADELEEQQRIFRAQRADHSELTLVIAPTYACNYRCPYCYELGHNSIKGIMGDEVIEAIYRFIEKRYTESGFGHLSVQWYGGDPSLVLDVVEKMSTWMIGFCDERQIAYSAMILTNCNLIDEAAVQMLARCRVTKAFVTIDGLEQTHNARRVAADGSNSFERNVNAARLFREYGISVLANMNADRVNIEQFDELSEYLEQEAGVTLSFGRLCDYGRFFGTRDFKRPQFDLFEHEEFCRMAHEKFASSSFDASTLKAMLAPQERFCRGQRDDYYVIDTIGDVYSCDGWIGEAEHIKFNILDEPTHEQLHMVSHDPFESEQCSACRLLPLCWGNCDWERRCGNMECHPLLTTMPDYLQDYASCFEIGDEAFQLLVAPRS